MLSEAAKILNTPERTLRHQAATGKIKVKKDGKFWSCYIEDQNSQPKINELPAQHVQSKTIDPEDDNGPNEERRSFPIEYRKPRRFGQLDSLGVYKDMKWFYGESLTHLKDDAFLTLLRSSINFLAQGFYEYEFTRKIDKFKCCRDTLANAIVTASLPPIDQKSEKTTELKQHLELKIMPGLSGLIRKIEKKRKPQERTYVR